MPNLTGVFPRMSPILGYRTQRPLTPEDATWLGFLVLVYIGLMAALHRVRGKRPEGLGPSRGLLAPTCPQCPGTRMIPIVVRRQTRDLDEKLHRCPQCGRVAGPGIWEEFQPPGAELPKSGVFVALLRAKKVVRGRPKPPDVNPAAARPPAWVDSMQQDERRRPDYRPPLWDRWLDG